MTGELDFFVGKNRNVNKGGDGKGGNEDSFEDSS